MFHYVSCLTISLFLLILIFMNNQLSLHLSPPRPSPPSLPLFPDLFLCVLLLFISFLLLLFLLFWFVLHWVCMQSGEDHNLNITGSSPWCIFSFYFFSELFCSMHLRGLACLNLVLSFDAAVNSILILFLNSYLRLYRSNFCLYLLYIDILLGSLISFGKFSVFYVYNQDICK